MTATQITYHISVSGERAQKHTFEFSLDDNNYELIGSDANDAPPWTQLSYRQCSHCPLNKEEHSHCPLALNMHHIVQAFSENKSIDPVEMDVETQDRRIIQKTDLQHAISSMLELIYPSCGCPKTQLLKPTVRFHLPILDEEEAIFRMTSTFLLGSFLSNADKNGQADFSGLNAFYEDMNLLNRAVASRLQTATQSDACKNAITLLDMYSTLIPVLIEDKLTEMRQYFKGFLPEGEIVSSSKNHIAEAIALALTPIDDEAVPQWMTDLNQAPKEQENKSDNKTEDCISETDKILQASTLTLSLEPVESESNDSPFKLPNN